MYRLREVYIKDFRGFREERIKFPESSIILLVGNNGTGKTSFFDAFEWGFTGSLKRYEPENQEKNKEIFLTNKYGTNGFVEIKLEDEDKSDINIRREIQLYRGNDFNHGKLFINGKKNKNISDLLIRDELKKDFDFNTAFKFSHLLCQELINNFVRSYKGPQRYTVLSNLVGVQKFSIYRDNINLLRRRCENKIMDLNKSLADKEREMLRLEASLNKEPETNQNLQQVYLELVRDISLNDKKLLSEEILTANVFSLDTEQVFQNIADRLNKLNNARKKYTKNAAEIKRLQNERGDFEKSAVNINKIENQIRLIKISFVARYFSEEKTLNSIQVWINSYREYIKRKENLLFILNSNLTDIEKINALKEADKVSFIKCISSLIEEIEKAIEDIRGIKNNIRAIERRIKEAGDIQTKLLLVAQEYFEEEKDIQKCPVCLSSISLEEVINGLRERLDIVSKGAGKHYQEKIKEERDRLERAIARREDLNEKSTEIFDRYKEIVTNRMIRATERKESCLQRLKVQERCGRFLQDLGLEYKGSAVLKELTGIEEQIIDDHHNIEGVITEKERELGIEEKIVYKFKTDLKNSGILAVNDLDGAYQNITDNINSIEVKIDWLKEIENRFKELKQKTEQSGSNRRYLEIKKAVEIYKKQIGKMEERADKLKKVEKRVPALINDMTEKIINPYKELANKIYGKINPQPFFDTIDWERDSTGANNTTLVLKVRSKDGQQANPSYIYSVAQINIIVLSLFMSFAIQNNWSKLNCFFMDDPVQNMDDINIFSFIDVLRSIYLNNPQPPQLFISTHDQKIYSFLKKKFRMFNPCTIEFKSYGKNGPMIEVY